ncbi:MAG TPA: tetratricopeptide repeat protein [Vicinamibacteria bacterium]|nr:tetratricopeptide repeat protein [Vicinamibacteria bacterium]
MYNRPLLIAAGLVALLGPPAAASDDQGHREALMHYRAGEDSMTAERWAEAVIEFKEAIRLDPLLAVAHYELGQAFMPLKRYPDAIKAYLGARQAFTDLATLEQTDRVKADLERDDQIQELQTYLTRLRRMNDPRYDHLQIKVQDQIEGLQGTGRKGLARRLEVPAEVFMALGSAHYRSGALGDAEREYLAAIKVKPGFGEAHNNLAVVYMLTGRFDEAEGEIKLAEKAGFRVSPKFKDDLARRAKGQ